MSSQAASPPVNQEADFSKAEHTFIVSDIHLTHAEPVNPKDPLWRKFKTRKFFIDNAFDIYLKKIQEEVKKESKTGIIELILAGDIFDFDGVTLLPLKHKFVTTFLERRRGLNSEERKSRFKMTCILRDHNVFFESLSKFIKNGHKVIFIIGNHDLELHWASVQNMVRRSLDLTAEENRRVRFNQWFYISNSDTLIEHGNQYDSHCSCQNPVNPKIKGLRKERIRMPFGSIAHRYLLNGMGYFNPHSDRTFILTFTEYIKFAVKHLIRKEPLIMWTWFWGSVVALLATIKEGIAYEVKDPLMIEEQVEEIAKNSNATPRMVRELREIHAPPAFTDPIGVMRELWLDRAFTVILTFLGSFWFLNFINFVWKVSYWWVFGIFLLFLPFFIFNFRSIKSKVIVPLKHFERAVKLGSRITRVKRVVFGHTHEFVHANFDGIEYLNSGTWSPAFDDVECTKPSCPKTFVWIRPDPNIAQGEADAHRIANVFEWKTDEMKLLC